MLTNTQKLTYSAMLLAIAIISMIFKGGGVFFVVFVTGAIVNACIIIDSHLCGILHGVILSVITPIAAYFISPNPVHQTVPLVVPCIMIGNALIAICVALIGKKEKTNIMLPVSMGVGSIVKAVFMGIAISLLILPNMLPEKLMPNLKTLQFTFSVVQLFAALVGSVYAYIVLNVITRLKPDQTDN